MNCAVTERYRAVTFRPEFTVLVEFCAADKFHYTRAADTVNTVKNCRKATYMSRLKALEGRPVNSKKPFKGSSSKSNVGVEVEGP